MDNPQKHWNNSFRWEMTIIRISRLKEGLNVTRFISIFVVEVTTIDNSTWVGIHAYVLEKWK
jgi:hypothetical protein